MSILKLENVSHHYFSTDNYKKALDNISFSIQPGEFISLLGPSGCGKSTILSIIAKLVTNTSGDIYLNGKNLKETKDEIGYMLQQDYLYPWKTILENVLLGPKIQNRETKEITQKAIDMLKEVDLENVHDQYPESLSGGMRQRAALVRTLINDPEIFLLDEPFSSLDFQTKLKLEELVANILKNYHKTTILVTHDIGEAIAMSDRIILMKANPGRISHIYEVPIELRDHSPMLARKHPKFQGLFDEIWSDLENVKSPVELGDLK
ncbi:ABC transporter ATP-binding protein [Oceanobacillus sp. CAU 1775]